ncbi:MAG: zinc ribbon domain-containing protein [Chloroflexi bacterium]|nr:zinc ribbon domain-containing protein [Chloroflexota bacterium]
MPIYEFYCPRCHAQFELTRPFSQSDQPAPCPKCGGEARKLVSACAANADYRVRVPEKQPFRKLPGGD